MTEIDFCDLGTFITVAAAAVVLLIKAVQLSKCREIELCCGLVTFKAASGDEDMQADDLEAATSLTAHKAN